MEPQKKTCINCENLKYTGVNEIYRCEDNRADVHPLLRTMNDGEAFGRYCGNCWKYREPTSEMIKRYPKLNDGYIV